MSWIKVLTHDLRCGLLRWRSLFVPFLVVLTCIQMGGIASHMETRIAWIDFMLNIFKGKEPIVNPNPRHVVELPFSWFLVVGGCLLFNLDYLLYDLTNAGQQVILRNRSRNGWYLSKCVWNFCSVALYFALIALTATLMTLWYGGDFSLSNTAELSTTVFDNYDLENVVLTAWQGLATGVLMPFLSVAALSMLQMTLCLFVKPVLSFLVCQGLLVLAVFWNSPYALGIGAMTIRNFWVAESAKWVSIEGVDPLPAALMATAVLLVSVIAGSVCFRHSDILGMEE